MKSTANFAEEMERLSLQRKQPRFQRTVGTTGKELADLKEQRALNAFITRFRERSTG